MTEYEKWKKSQENNSKMSEYETWKMRKENPTYELDSDTLSLNKTINKSLSGWQDSNTMSKTRNEVSSMLTRLDSVKSYLKKNNYNDKEYSDNLDELIATYKTALSSIDDHSKYYSQYKNADAYNKAYKTSQIASKYEGKSYADMLKNYDKADKDERNWIDQNKYQYMNTKELEADKSKLEAEKDAFKKENGGKLRNNFAKLGAYINAGNFSEDIVNQNRADAQSNIDKLDEYDHKLAMVNQYITNRNIQDKVEKLDDNSLKLIDEYNASKNTSKAGYLDQIGQALSGAGGYSETNSQIQSQSIGEKNEALIALQNTINPVTGKKFTADEVQEYAELRQVQKDMEDQADRDADAKKFAEEHAISSVLLARASNFVGGFTGTAEIGYQTLEKLAGERQNYNTYDAMFAPTRATQTIDQTNMEDMGIIGKGAYQVATSMADNALRAIYASAVGGVAGDLGMSVEAVDKIKGITSGALMSSQIMPQAIIEGKEKGYSDGKAMANAIVSSIIEGVTEAVSMEQILKPQNSKNILTHIIKSFVAEGSEEVASNVLNRIYDDLANGQYSEFNQLIEQYKEQGYDDKQALVQTIMDVAGDDLEAFLIGGLSGAGMGGGTYALNSGINAINNKAETQSLANELTDVNSYGNAYRLAQISVDNDLAQQYSQAFETVKNNEDIAKAKLDNGKLTKGNFAETSEGKQQVKQLNKTAYKVAKQMRKNVSSELKETRAKATTDYLRENGATEEQIKAVEEFVNGKGFNNKEARAFESIDEKLLTDAIVSGEKALNVEYSQKMVSAIKASGAKEKIQTDDYKINNEQEAPVMYNGEAQGIKKFDSIADGKVTLDNGETVDVADLDLTKDSAIIIEGIRDYANRYNIAEDDASILLDVASGIIGTQADTENTMYAINDALRLGAIGIEGGDKALMNSNFIKSVAKVKEAYNAVQKAYDISYKASVTVNEQRESEKDFSKVVKSEGNLGYDKSVTSMDNYTREQKAESFVLKQLVKNGVISNRIVLFDSQTTTDENLKNKNGKFVTKEGTIWIDIHAEQGILGALSHELTHMIKQFDNATYKQLGKILFEGYGDLYNKYGAESIEDVIKFYQAKNNNSDSDLAYEEFVADMMTEMLSSTNAIETIAKLRGTMNEKAQNKFIATIKKVLNALKKFFAGKDSKGYSKLLTQMNNLQNIVDVWSQGVANAMNVVELSKENIEVTGVNIDASTMSVAPTDVFSEKTWTQSEYVQNKKETAKKIAEELKVSVEQAEKYIDDINSVARLIADDRVRLDYDSNVDDKSTAMKPNSEYTWTIDMSTLCAKRLLFTGTFDAIQKALPNTVFDSDDIVLLRKMMQDKNYEVACGICYVESTRREIGAITNEFIERYKEAQKTGKPISKINASGQEKILTEKGTKRQFFTEEGYTPTLAELNTTDIDLVKRDHPDVYKAYLAFMNSRGQQKPKLLETRTEYKNEILKLTKNVVNSLNVAGGLRLQSFSDFEIAHLIDMMQVVMDMSRKGLKSQAYTKVPAFAEAFGRTGVKINLSLIAKGDGLDANGNLIFDDVEGINHKEAFRLRNKFSKNVGTILVGKNDAHIIKAMADPRIDFIIPFHKSSWKESLYESLGLTGYADYTDTQNERYIDKTRGKCVNFAPSEYWDYSKTGDENAQIYLEKCKQDGRIPKFPQFQNYEGYWKLLIDFKMYDNDGVGSPQEVVKPIFDNEVNKKILDGYEGGHRSFPVANDIVDEFVEQYKKNKSAEKYSTKEHKQAQYELIQKTNPKDESINKYATWIDKPSDVRTFREALEEDGGYRDGVAPDFTAEDIQKALKSGYVTVYSTYPIKNGVFVSPSRMEAESYGVRDKIHTKRVALTDVAWIDAGQGQYAKVDDAKFSTKDSEGKTLTPEQQEYFKDSKVIDTKGNLLRVYHASVEDFNVFDKDKIRKVDYDAPFNGFWFSNNKNTSPAMRQGKYLKSGYLNVTNPAPLKVWRQVVKEVINDDVSNPMSRSSNDEVRYRLQDMGYDGVHWDGVPDVDWDKFYADGYVEFNDVRGYKFALRLNEDYGDIDLIDLHYDYGEVVTGYEDRADFEKMQEEVWVAFESNQFKNADNTNPTDSEDVRYSPKEVQDYVNDSKEKKENKEYLTYSNLTANEVKKLSKIVGVNLIGYKHAMRANDIRHFLLNINNPNENTIDDILYIPEITLHPDIIYKGKNTKVYNDNKKLSNNPTICYIKFDGFMYFYVEQVIDEDKILATKQMKKFDIETIPDIVKKADVSESEKAELIKKITELSIQHAHGSKTTSLSDNAQDERMDTDSSAVYDNTTSSAESQSTEMNSLKDDYVIDNNFAVMTRERILREIEDSSAGTNKAYARRYITTISPTDYLNLTTGTRTRELFDEKIGGDYGNKMGEYDYDIELAQNKITPYLMIDLDNKRVIGHDGRHRMRALEKKGIDSVEIVVEFYNQYGMVKYPNGYDGVAEAIRFLNVIPQDFKYLDDDVIDAIEEEYEKDSPEYNDAVKIARIKNSINNPNTRITAVTLEDVMPLNRNYQDRILATYGEDANREASVKYSQKETPRDILLSTFSGLAQNDIEQKYLDDYRKNITELNNVEKQLKNTREELKELSFSKGKRDKERIASLRNTATRLENQLTVYDKKLLRLESAKPIKDILDRQKRDAQQYTKQKIAEVRKAERQKSKERLDTLVSDYQQKRKTSIQKRKNTAIRTEIKKVIHELGNTLNKPTKGHYVPQELVNPVAEVLSAINIDSGRSEKLSEKLALLKVKYDEIAQDSKYSIYHNDVISEMINSVVKEIGDTSIYDMNNTQLNAVLNLLKGINHTVKNAVKVKNAETELDAFQFAQQLIKETDSIDKRQDKLGDKYINAMLRPETMFNRLGNFHKNSYWNKLYNILNEGQLKQTQLMMEGQLIFADLFDDKQLESLSDRKNLVDIGLKDADGNSVKVTRGMMLSIYMALMNEQNAKHITMGGYTVPALKDYYHGKTADAFGAGSVRTSSFGAEIAEITNKINGLKRELKVTEDIERQTEIEDEIDNLKEQRSAIYADAENYGFSLLKNIQREMTDFDRQVVQLADKFFNEWSKNQLNKTTLEEYGFEKANVEKYYPINTDKNFLSASFEQITKDMSLENVGFMKERINGANPILLEDITDVINRQIKNVAQYSGMMPAVAQFNRIYGKTTSGYASSVQDSINKKFGKNGKDYIANLMSDIVGSRQSQSTFFDTLRGTMAGATLSLNPRVALAQTASYPTAMAELGAKPLAKALAKGGKGNAPLSRADKELIMKYSPLLYHRMQGFSTQEIGDAKTMRMAKNQVMDKMKWAMGWINAFDGATVGRLWYASQYYVDEHNPKLQKGTDAYYEEVAKVFNRVVERTQPNYTTLQRPDVLRNPNALFKQLTMFMTQRLQNFNILYDSVQTLKTAKADRLSATEIKEAKNNVTRAITSQLIASAMIVGMKALVDFLLHSVNSYRDDDEDLTAESVSLTLLNNFAETLVSNVIAGSETYEIAKTIATGDRYYGISLNGVDSFTDAIEKFVKTAQMTANGELDGDSVLDLAKSVSQLMGIPLANAMKMVNAVIYHAEDIGNGEFLSYEAGVERTNKQNINRYTTTGDSSIIDEMVDSKIESGKTEKEAKSAVRSSMTSYYKQMYLDAYNKNNSVEMARIRKLMYESGVYGSANDVVKTCQKWIKDSKK